MTQFRSETTDAGTQTAERFKQLIGQARMDGDEIEIGSDAADPADHALAYYRFICGADKAELKARWYSALERAHRKLDSMGVTDELDDLEIQGVQTVIFGHDMMQSFAESIRADTDALPDEDALHQAIEYMIGRVGPAGSRKSHVDRFVELFGRAAAAGDYLHRGTHYELTNEGMENEEIRINLPRTFDAISKYARDHDIDGVDLLNDHNDYRDRFREQASTPGTYVTRTMQYTPGVSNCTGIRSAAVMDEIEFDRDVLQVQLPLDDDSDDTASDDQPSGPTAINRLTDSRTSTGYETVTVEVRSWERADADTLSYRGMFTDATGIIDIIAFDELESVPDDPEGGHYRVEGVQVDRYDGDLQLVLKQKATTWTEIQPGVGSLEHADDESNQNLSSAAEADGGSVADTSDDGDDTASDDDSDQETDTGDSDTVSTAASDSDDTALDDMASDADTAGYTDPDSDLSDADWKEIILTVLNANNEIMDPDTLKQAVADLSSKNEDVADRLVDHAQQTDYLERTPSGFVAATKRLQGAVDQSG